jgi:uncharacterized protein (TIGR00269 family)
MKCRVCRGPAVIDVRRQNANYCRDHFLRMCRDQVAKAIHDFDMLRPGERVLVAVSGGKDSLACWHILRELGYDADGFVIGLGIGDYSDESTQFARSFATARGWKLHETSLRHEYGYDVVVTGHNLDDEAAVLFGNVLRWQTDYLGRQRPVLPERNGFPRKVKPLVRLGEREMAAYCVLAGIDYIVEECPMAAGNKHLGYKEALNAIEAQSPGSKHDFYFGFLKRASERFLPEAEAEQDDLEACSSCGAPTTGDVCAFCKLVERSSGHEPVTLRERR